jgi:hypothetical protein
MAIKYAAYAGFVRQGWRHIDDVKAESNLIFFMEFKEDKVEIFKIVEI